MQSTKTLDWHHLSVFHFHLNASKKFKFFILPTFPMLSILCDSIIFMKEHEKAQTEFGIKRLGSRCVLVGQPLLQ